jgi:hypothetical protein
LFIGANTRPKAARYLAAVARLRRRRATISATIEIAISSGVMAPRSKPAGALSRARPWAATPRSARFAFRASAFLRLPTTAAWPTSAASAAPQRGLVAAALRGDKCRPLA